MSIAISNNNEKLYLIEIGPNLNGSVVNSENRLWKKQRPLKYLNQKQFE